jgi:hypothetical protein
MKQLSLFLLIFILSSCYTAQVCTFEPYGTQNITIEQNKKIAYQNEDSVIVSVDSKSYRDSVFTLEAVIDNQSGHAVEFNPQKTYLFRYNNDTALNENKIYFAANREQVLKSLDEELDQQSDKLVGKAMFSILLGAAFIAADVASINNDDIADAMPAIAASHDVAQIALDVSRENNYEKIDRLESQIQEIKDQTSPEIKLEPHRYVYVTLKFNVPYSSYYRIYFEVNERIYQFTFQGSNKLGG